MLAAVGHPVTRLHRRAYAGLTVEGLEPGAFRELEPCEVQQLASQR
jgi:23S rRNA pseudouridine2605 synthase